jgi:hypothetical protein
MRFNWKRVVFTTVLVALSFELGHSYTQGVTCTYVEATPNATSTLKPGYVYQVGKNNLVVAMQCNQDITTR